MSPSSVTELQRLRRENTELQRLQQGTYFEQAELERLQRENATLRAAHMNTSAPSFALDPELVDTSAALSPEIIGRITPRITPGVTSHAEDFQGVALPLAHFAGSCRTYETLKTFNLPMTMDGKFKIVKYLHKGHEKHPYWYRERWNNHKDKVVRAGQIQRVGNMAVAQGDEKETFLTNPDGTPVTPQRAREIRGYAYEIWRDYAAEHGVAALPRTWMKATTTFKVDFTRLILGDAPELGFCHDGWHSDALGQDNWSQWQCNFLASVDPCSLDDLLLAEEVCAAKVKHDKKMASRRIKRNTRKTASLVCQARVCGRTRIHRTSQACTHHAAIHADNTPGLDGSLGPLPVREDFDFEYLPLRSDADVSPGDVSSGDVTGFSDERNPGDTVTSTSGGGAACDIAAQPDILVSSAAPSSDLIVPADSTTSLGDLQDADATHGSDSTMCLDPAVPSGDVPDSGSPLNAVLSVHPTSSLDDISSGPSDPRAKLNTGSTLSVNASVNVTVAPANISETEESPSGPPGDATAQPARARVANPFMAILAHEDRVPIAPAQIAPVAPSKDKKTKAPKGSAAWPPVQQRDTQKSQKEICAILWYKETGGTKAEFNKFYGSMKDGARKKWKSERDAPAAPTQEDKLDQSAGKQGGE
ncbi:hypothetical protein K466DRAFT_607068 [Polyporus arcularius HHB13444]|uniref:Uncharacterized protein n=1 Tax=Polyporus arcularius HHB13444 TaxID=1314778 RepID=A0A5C3NNU7_9APHY|nr:hypothetical protein K466DRAFT_607068 [Polyporus arcularius HHB13444]